MKILQKVLFELRPVNKNWVIMPLPFRFLSKRAETNLKYAVSILSVFTFLLFFSCKFKCVDAQLPSKTFSLHFL